MYNAVAKKESAFHHFGGKSKTSRVHETSNGTAFVNEDGFGRIRGDKKWCGAQKIVSEIHSL